MFYLIQYKTGVQHLARELLPCFINMQLCNFKYRYIVYCCSIVLIKLVSDFHSFRSFILIRDAWGLKLRYLLTRRMVLRQLRSMIYCKTVLFNWWATTVPHVGRDCSVINKIFLCEKNWITKVWNVLCRLTCSKASTHFLHWFCIIFSFIFSCRKKHS